MYAKYSANLLPMRTDLLSSHVYFCPIHTYKQCANI